METAVLTPAAEIRAAADAYRAENPKARARNVAQGIGVSEAQLLATGVGTNVVVLRPEFGAILSSLEPLGRLMALTRNDACVHERKGVYSGFQSQGPHTLFVGKDIDLRIFLRAWASAFAVEEHGRSSLQFFDRAGQAVHKVYATGETNTDGWNALVEQFRADEQADALAVSAPAPRPAETPEADLDLAAFYDGWRALTDTHDFFPLLRTHGVSRRQAVRNAPADLARPVSAKAARQLLEGAAATGQSIMCFVGNDGCIQIHTGPVAKIVEHGPWINVLDEAFNLHLDETKIAEAYVVTKPGDTGDVTALEVFDQGGEMIVQFFGARKPGLPERDDWRTLAASLR